MKNNEAHNGIFVGYLFTAGSLLLGITQYRYMTLFAGLFFRALAQRILKGHLNNFIGITTIFFLLFFLSLTLYICTTRINYRSLSNKIISKWAIALYMLLFCLLMQPLVFFIYWISWDLTVNDDAAIFEFSRIFVISSFLCVMFGFIIDRIAKSKGRNIKNKLGLQPDLTSL